MSSLNKAILIGHLGRDPEIRSTPDGTPVANFSLATSESWTDRSGTRQERTEWHNIVAWRKLADLCKRYLTKGRQVYVEGRIQTREWDDRDGNKRRTTEIVANQIVFLGSRAESTEVTGAEHEVQHSPDPQPQARPPEVEITDDDIPF